MKLLRRSAVGTIAAVSLMWVAIPAATAEAPSPGTTGGSSIESLSVPESGTEPADGSNAGSSTSPTSLTLTGWRNEDGLWYYYEQGVRKTGWLSQGGFWFYLREDGSMATGWAQDGSTWYYFEATGVMRHDSWINSGGRWFYLTASGAMATNTWIGDYYVQEDGSMVTDTGNWVTIRGSRYRFNSSGRWVSVYSGTYTCPGWAPIKGNRDSMIYHMPSQRFYNATKAEECFAHESDAQNAGYRKAKV